MIQRLALEKLAAIAFKKFFEKLETAQVFNLS